MRTFNAVLDYDTVCYAYKLAQDGNKLMANPDCTGNILAGEPHHVWEGASLGLRGMAFDDARNKPRFCRSCVRNSNWNIRYEQMDRILVKVELTYHDGSKSVLEGDAADNWDLSAGGASVMSAIHGSPFPELPWQKIPASK